MRQHRKQGFNLIEIAIVLAVVGLVIGGIYTAASAVTENNRQRTVTQQILQIAHNVRDAYANQADYVELTHEQIRRMGIFPADMIDNGTDFLGSYGDRTHLADGASTGYASNTFYISYYSVPQAACINILAKTFGSPKAARDMGVVAAGTWPNHFISGAGLTNGISVAEALSVCDNSSPNSIVPHTNELCLIFSLH